MPVPKLGEAENDGLIDFAVNANSLSEQLGQEWRYVGTEDFHNIEFRRAVAKRIFYVFLARSITFVPISAI